MMNSTKLVVFIGKKKMQCHSSVYAEDATRKEKNNKKKCFVTIFRVEKEKKNERGPSVSIIYEERKERKGIYVLTEKKIPFVGLKPTPSAFRADVLIQLD